MSKVGPDRPAVWRRRLLLAAGGLVLLLLTGFLRSRYHLQAARDALERGDLDAAQGYLSSYLRVWPNSGETRFLAARAARRGDAEGEAAQHLDVCRRLGYEPEKTALEKGLLAVQQGRLAGFEDALRGLVRQQHPETALILEALAKGYMKTFRLGEALACLTLLLQREPDHARALVLRGQCEALREEDEEALADCRRAVSLAPQLPEAHLALATALFRLGHADEAAGHYQWLRMRQGDNPEVMARLALCLQDLAQFAEARNLLDELLARHPDYVPGLVERGRVAFRLGDAEAGERDARRALELAPHDADAPLVLALCLEARGRTEQARRYRRQWQQHDADTATVYRLSLRLGASPRDPNLHYQRGVALLRLGHDREGERSLLSALHLDPGHRRARAALAEYYARTGRADSGVRLLTPDP